MPEMYSERVFRSTLILLGLIGIAIIIYATPLGLGLREDSFSYITAAESFASTTGLGRWAADGTFRPLTHFPPLLPLILAGFRVLDLEILPTFRIINAGLFGLLIVTAGFTARELTESKFFSLLTAVIVITSRVLIEVYAWAHSEPLYLSLSLLGLLCFAKYLRTPSRNYLLLGSSFAIGLAFLTRFAGVSLIISCGIVLVFMNNLELKFRLKKLLAFLLFSVLPVLFFIGRNVIYYGSMADRPTPTFHPPASAIWRKGAETLLGWAIPYRLFKHFSDRLIYISTTTLLFLFCLVCLLLLTQGLRRCRDADRPGFAPFLILSGHLLSYALVILLTVFFIDRLTPLNDRLLSPIYLIGLLLIVKSAQTWWENNPSKPFKIAALAVALLVIAIHGYRGVQEVRTIHREGLGLATRQWATSPTLRHIRGLPTVPIFTNDIPAIYFYTQRNAAFIPIRINPADARPRQDYIEQLEAMRTAMREKGAILVILGPNPWMRINPTEFETLTLGLSVIEEFPDGLIFTGQP